MKVTIHYFAIIRDEAKRDRETRTTSATTLDALYAELVQAYGFTIPIGKLRVAVNDAFVTMDAKLRDGDEVTFIPPVAGG